MKFSCFTYSSFKTVRFGRASELLLCAAAPTRREVTHVAINVIALIKQRYTHSHTDRLACTQATIRYFKNKYICKLRQLYSKFLPKVLVNFDFLRHSASRSFIYVLTVFRCSMSIAWLTYLFHVYFFLLLSIVQTF